MKEVKVKIKVAKKGATIKKAPCAGCGKSVRKK
jgi:hypothetical protein